MYWFSVWAKVAASPSTALAATASLGLVENWSAGCWKATSLNTAEVTKEQLQVNVMNSPILCFRKQYNAAAHNDDISDITWHPHCRSHRLHFTISVLKQAGFKVVYLWITWRWLARFVAGWGDFIVLFISENSGSKNLRQYPGHILFKFPRGKMFVTVISSDLICDHEWMMICRYNRWVVLCIFIWKIGHICQRICFVPNLKTDFQTKIMDNPNESKTIKSDTWFDIWALDIEFDVWAFGKSSYMGSIF